MWWVCSEGVRCVCVCVWYGCVGVVWVSPREHSANGSYLPTHPNLMKSTSCGVGVGVWCGMWWVWCGCVVRVCGVCVCGADVWVCSVWVSLREHSAIGSCLPTHPNLMKSTSCGVGVGVWCGCGCSEGVRCVCVCVCVVW